MDNLERRSISFANDDSKNLLRIERRCDCEEDGEEGREWIVGYAAKFGVNSLEIDGEFIERIDPSAFGIVTERRGRKKPLETRALFNHNADMPLARYPKTLRMTVDEIGLRYEFPVPNSSYGQDLASNIEDGIISGSSFSFTVGKGGDEWSVENGRSLRVIRRIDSLIDVGPVTFPAYPDADVSVARRSYDIFRKTGRRTIAVPQLRRSSRIDEIARKARSSLAEYIRKHGS